MPEQRNQKELDAKCRMEGSYYEAGVYPLFFFFSSVVFSFEDSDEELFLFILLSSNLQNLYHFPKMHWHV